MVGFFQSLRRKEKKENFEKPNFEEKEVEKKVEILTKGFDKEKFVSQVKKFLEKNDDPFDYATYEILDLPDNKGICFKIEYGMKNPTFTFFITLEITEKTIRIHDHVPANYSSWMEMSLLPVLNLQKSINAVAYRVKLWKFIESITKPIGE